MSTEFVFEYSATAFLLHRLLLKRWIPQDWAWTIPRKYFAQRATFVVNGIPVETEPYDTSKKTGKPAEASRPTLHGWFDWKVWSDQADFRAT